MLDLFLVILFCIFGVLTGVMSGILPGLHVNNIALILLSLSGAIVGFFGFLAIYGISEHFILLLICVFIIATSVSHTFHDTLPSTFLGAPDEDKALSVLPAHALLLEGKGYEAVVLSVIGSFGGIVCCVFLMYPLKFFLGEPMMFYNKLKELMLFVLIAISIIMIATEKSKINDFCKKGIAPSIIGMLFALFVFVVSGVFGLIIFEIPVDSPIGLSSPVLFPALAGLFGTPTLFTSLFEKPVIPKQKIEEVVLDKKTKKSSILSVFTGSIAGIFVSIIPGIASAIGTIIAMSTRGESDKRQTIITLSAVNSACVFFNVIALFVIMRSRSGVTQAAMQLISIEEWSSVLLPFDMIYLLISMILAGVLSYFLTLKIGKIFAKKFGNVPYLLLIKIVIIFVIILVFLFTGFIGLLVLLVATFIGLLPVLWGVRRSHCMGVLLIPILLYFI